MRKWLASRSDIILGGAVLMLLTQLTFLPYIWGDRTLQDSAVQASSLYSTGSRYPPVVPVNASRVLDAGAPAWETEPQLALTHSIAFVQHAPPLWNPYSAFGTPLAADMISQPYSPFAWVPIVWPGARGYDFFVALRICAAGFFLFLFLRQFVAFVPALVGGVSFMYTGCLWLYVTMPELSVEVVTPALLYAIERLLRRPSLHTAAVFSLFFGVSMLGGMPESSLLILSFLYVYAIARVAGDRSLRDAMFPIVRHLAIGSVVGVGLAAILLVPFLEYLSRSWSTHAANVDVGTRGDPFSFQWLALYLAPLLNGPPWNNIFLNFHGGAGLRGFFFCSGMFFALLATFSAFADAIKAQRAASPELLFSSVAFVLLLKRFAFPLVNWIGAIPNFNRVDFPKYEEVDIACCVAALAAFGVARLAERRTTTIAALLAFLVPSSIIAAAATADYGLLSNVAQHREYFECSLAGAIIFLGAVATMYALAREGRLSMVQTSIGALALVVFEPLVVWIIPLYYIINPQAPQSASALLGAPFVADLQARLRDHMRFFAEDGVLFPEWSAVFGIPDARELDGLLPDRYLPFVRAFMPKEMSEELETRFVGAGDVDFSNQLVRRFLALASIQYVGLNHPLPDSGLLAGAALTHPELPKSMLRSGFFTIDGDTRPGLFMHPTAFGMPRTELPLRVDVPSSARSLRFSIGMLPAVWASTVCGDGVRFVIEMVSGARAIPLFHRYIDPKHDSRLRRWLDFDIPVTAYRGRAINLNLATEPGPSRSTCADWAVWGNMRLQPSDDRAAMTTLKLQRTEPGVQLYEFGDPLPRIAIYHDIVHARDQTDALRLLTDPTLDVSRTAVVENNDRELAAFLHEPAERAEGGRIEIYTPNVVRANVFTKRPALVVLNDTFFPGWRAYVDGTPVSIVVANYLFRGVFVGRGRHTIEFRYQPGSFRIGVLISAICLLEIVCALAAPYARRLGLGRHSRER